MQDPGLPPRPGEPPIPGGEIGKQGGEPQPVRPEGPTDVPRQIPGGMDKGPENVPTI